MASTPEQQRARKAANQRRFYERHPDYQRDYYRKRSQEPGYRERKAEQRRQARAKNPGRDTETQRRWRQANPEKHRAHNRKSRYGITAEQYAALLDAGCAICGVSPEPGGKGLHVDHDHACCPGGKACGKCIRGLLCTDCNYGLGRFKDNKELLMAAIEYLARPPLWAGQ